MAFLAKLTVKRGQPNLKDVALAAGTNEAQTDTISINIDATKISKGDALTMIDNAKQKILAGKWPPL